MRELNTVDHWDTVAESYETSAHPYTARYVESVLARVPLTPQSRILDVATGTGALALAAARLGSQILATDFSPEMVARIAAKQLPNVEVRVMDGQALDLADASFDAVFSFFGVFMFPDWRKGLAEMARVTRPGGHGIVAVWQDRGAGAFLLLSQLIRKLFPQRELATMPEGMRTLNSPDGLAREMIGAGYRNPRIEPVTRDFELDIAALNDADKHFGFTPDWTGLDAAEKAAVVAEMRLLAGDRTMLAIPSTALIAVAER